MPSFGDKLGSVVHLGESRMKVLKRHADDHFQRGMEAVCPLNPHAAFDSLRSSATWRAKWCPGMEEEDLLELPFIAGMVHTYLTLNPHPNPDLLQQLYRPSN